ncbi:MAG: AraC family transcriptional regulator [Bacteroidota bacterium]
MNDLSYPVINHVVDAKFAAKKLKAQWLDNHYTIPEKLGQGIVEAYDYEVFSVMLSSFKLKEDLRIERISSDIKGYLLFGFILNGTTSKFVVKSNRKLGRLHYGANITTPITSSFGFFKKNIWHKQVSILVKTEWLKRFWKIDFPEEISSFHEPLFIILEMSVQLAKSLRLVFEGDHSTKLRKKHIELKCKESILYMAELISDGILEHKRKYHPDDLNTVLSVGGYLNENFNNLPPIKNIAQNFCMNKDKLYAMFKSIYGSTITAYVTELRLEKAYELLVKGFSVSEVGIVVGYTNLSHFARIFKKAYGLNPSEILQMDSNKRPSN